MAKLRVVLDTNVLVSALLRPQGAVGAVLGKLRDDSFQLIYSPAILDELIEVLSRSWLREKYGVTDQTIEALLKLILLRGEVVEPKRAVEICRDPEDDKFIEAAVNGTADVLVSGDRDLSDLAEVEGIAILPPAKFLKKYQD